MHNVKIFTSTGGVKEMENEINRWLGKLSSEYSIILMTQSESKGSLIITFLYR